MVQYSTIFENSEPQDDLFLNLIDLDRLFASSPNAIILNHLKPSDPDYATRRNAAVIARAGALNFVARCDCGELEGNLNTGLKCPSCGTYCRLDFSSTKELEHNIWLSIPKGIKGVLHPVAYNVLTTWLYKKGSVNYIDAILDPKTDLPVEIRPFVGGRGHNYLYENFDYLMANIIEFVRTDRKSKVKRENSRYIEMFISAYRDVMFCTKLPVMATVLNSMTSPDGTSEGRQYADASLQLVLDAITDLQQVEETTMRTRPKTVSSIVHRIYKSYIEYLSDIAKNRLSRKESLARKHVLGTRLHFSVRGVIIPHQDRYDELYFPWIIGVNLLKLHIIGRLVRKHGMTVGEATIRHMTALVRYDLLIDQIMEELIEECKPEFRGLPVAWGRNPSLKRGAVQLLYVPKIKKDLEDVTVNLSPLIVRGPNADFDGDAMYGILLCEMDTAKAYKVLHPAMRHRSTNTSAISDEITLPKQTLAVLNSFLQSTRT